MMHTVLYTSTFSFYGVSPCYHHIKNIKKLIHQFAILFFHFKAVLMLKISLGKKHAILWPLAEYLSGSTNTQYATLRFTFTKTSFSPTFSHEPESFVVQILSKCHFIVKFRDKMHLKKLLKKKEFLYYTGGPLCTEENLYPGIYFCRGILSLR
jgi:hypothetical protein